MVSDRGSNVTLFPAYMVRHMKKQGTNVIETDLSRPQNIQRFMEVMVFFSHRKVSLPATTLQTPYIPDIFFNNVEG